jgi:DNA mismatch endonuclease (patch repair protein)
MTDVLTKKQRSYCMSRIRSKNTGPELLLQENLKRQGLKFETDVKSLPGRPDIVFKKRRLAIFVDGEFWHGKDFNTRKNNYNEYWLDKISKNISRDRATNKKLKETGWKVIRIWGRSLKRNPERYIKKIRSLLLL